MVLNAEYSHQKKFSISGFLEKLEEQATLSIPHSHDQLELQDGVHTKWIKDRSVRAKIINLSGKCRSSNLCDFGSGNGFSDITPKAQAQKEKKKKQNLKL